MLFCCYSKKADQFVCFTGGFNKEKVVLKNVLRYEPNLDKWIKVAPMNTPRARHGTNLPSPYVPPLKPPQTPDMVQTCTHSLRTPSQATTDPRHGTQTPDMVQTCPPLTYPLSSHHRSQTWYKPALPLRTPLSGHHRPRHDTHPPTPYVPLSSHHRQISN